MSAVMFPDDLQAWAEAEVAAGRAQSVHAIAVKALSGYRSALEDFRKSLDDAESEADASGWLDARDVFARMETELAAEIEAEKKVARTRIA